MKFLTAKSFFCVGLYLLGIHQLTAQVISATIDTSATYLINEVFLAGDCFATSSASLSGEYGQVGTFDGGLNAINIESGIILSTGNIQNISGPNTDPGTSTQYGLINNDPDLALIAGGENLLDVTILEFTFTPTVDIATFEYVFASEEYCEFVGTNWNDLFGFFVSGPGLNGPYTDNAVNIARVPTTSQEVAINTINHFINPSFYNNNIPLSQSVNCSNTAGIASDLFEYDGFTDVLTASVAVIPCQTYKIKIIIADRLDDLRDSAVFLKAGSFNAGLTSTVRGSISGDSFSATEPIEGCGTTSLIFSRADSLIANDLVVYFDLLPTNTATEGLDYSPIPDSVIIPAGVYADTLVLDIFQDNLVEGVETLGVRLRNPCDCNDAEINLIIYDPPPLSTDVSEDVTICLGDSTTMIALPQGGHGTLTYHWPGGGQDSIQSISPALSGDFTLTVNDACQQTATAEYHADVHYSTAAISGEGVLCQGLGPVEIPVVLSGATSYNFDVLNNGQTQNFTNIVADTFWISPNQAGNYSLINLNANNCPGDTEGLAIIRDGYFSLTNQIDSVDCAGAMNGQISVNPVDGIAPYQYNWSNTISTNSVAANLVAGQYTLTVTDENGCEQNATFTVNEPAPINLAIDSVQIVQTCVDFGHLIAQPTGGIAPFDFQWSNGETGAAIDSLESGSYTLNILDQNNCTFSETVTILSDQIAPLALINFPDTITCLADTIALDANNSSQNGPYLYEWLTPSGPQTPLGNPLLLETSETGLFTLSISNTSNGCSEEASVSVESNFTTTVPAIISEQSLLTCDQTTIHLTQNIAGADWQWSDELAQPLTTPNADTLSVSDAGWYFLTTTNLLSGCTASDSVLITADTVILTGDIMASNDLSCLNESAALTANVSGNQTIYSYQWSATNGGLLDGDLNTANVFGLASGDYSVSVSNPANGCSATFTIPLIDLSENILIDDIPDTLINCQFPMVILTGSSNNAGPLSFEWQNDQNVTLSNQAIVELSEEGEYQLLVSDTNTGCSDSIFVFLTEDFESPTAELSSIPLINCANSSSTINLLNPSSNTLQITWLDESGSSILENESSLTTFNTGNYTVELLDETNGCSSQQMFLVDDDLQAPMANILTPDSLGCAPNTVELSLENIIGSGQYLYNWTGPTNGITGPDDQQFITVQEAGLYQITLTDLANGCENILSDTVIENKVIPSLSPIADTLINCTNPSIILTGHSNSTAPLQFSWNDAAGQLIQTSSTLEINTSGDFQVVVEDLNNGCQNMILVHVDEDFEMPQAILDSLPVLTCANPDGLLSFTGEETWEPIWLDAAGTILNEGEWAIHVNTAAAYTLLITDQANGCQSQFSQEVSENMVSPIIDPNLESTLDCMAETYLLSIGNSSSGPAFNYQIFDENQILVYSGTDSLILLAEQSDYTFAISNIENGCVTESPVVLSTTAIEAAQTSITHLVCGEGVGSILFEEVSGGTEPFIYSINGGESFQSSPQFNQLEGGDYELIVQDINGCELALSALVSANNAPSLSLPEQLEIKLGESILLPTEVFDLSAPITTISWSPTVFLDCTDCLQPLASPLETQAFEIQITDENGCTARTKTIVIVDQRIPVFIPNVFSPTSADGINDVFTVFAQPSLIETVLAMNIYNRWGNLVFENTNFPPNSLQEGWDGTFLNSLVNPGVFIYQIEVLLSNGEVKYFHGDLLLMN